MKTFKVKLVSSVEEFIDQVSAGKWYFHYNAISEEGIGEVIEVTDTGAWLLRDDLYDQETGRGGGIIFKAEQTLFEII